MAAFVDPTKETLPFQPLDKAVSPLPMLAATPELTKDPLALTAPAAQPLSPFTAGNLFPHFADQPLSSTLDPALAPHKVQTVPVRNDVQPLLDEIGATNNRLLHETDRPQVPVTAGNLLTEMGKDGMYGLNQYAYILATVERESRGGTSVQEEYKVNQQVPQADRDAHFEKKYGVGTRPGTNVGNTQPGDGAMYPGRGLVQLTGRTNYTKWTNRLANEGVLHDGVAPDLVNQPDLATDPAIATKIAVEGMRDGGFTGAKLGRYVNDTKTDYYNARRVINGTDAAQDIADRAVIYENVIKGHSDAFYSSMLTAKENKLPTATADTPLTPLSGNLSGMLSPTLIGSGADHFGPVKDLFDKPLGQFKPVAEDKKAKITNITPAKPATTEVHDPAHQ